MISFIIIPLFMLISTPAHSAERELHDRDRKTNTALNVVLHKPPAWAEESRNKLILLLQEICNLPTDLGNIIVDMMGDCGYGKLFPLATIKNKYHVRGKIISIVTLSHNRFAEATAEDTIIKIYDAHGNLQHTLEHDAEVLSLSAYSHGTGIVASSSGGNISMWKLIPDKKPRLRREFSQLLSEHQIHENQFLELPPHHLVLGNYSTLQLWNIEKKTCLFKTMHNKHITTPLTKLSTGNIAVGCYSLSLKNQQNQIHWMLMLWNTTTNVLSYITSDHNNRMSTITALPHGLVATANYVGEKIIYVWDTEKGKLLHRLCPYRGHAFSLCALSNGHLASGAYNAIDIWNPSSGARIRTLRNNTMMSVDALLELPCGHLVAGGTGKNITIWDVVKGLCLQTLPCSDDIVTLKVLSDVKLLSATTNGEITLWNTAIDPEAFTLQASQTPSKPRTPQALSARNTAQSHCRIS